MVGSGGGHGSIDVGDVRGVVVPETAGPEDD